MKKLILATALLGLFSLSAEARDIQQGTFMVTGDTNLDIGSSKTSFSGPRARPSAPRPTFLVSSVSALC